MKTHLFAGVLVLTALTSLCAVNAFAQSDGSLVARIPFSFSIQQEQFPPGDYVVEPLQHGYIRLRGGEAQSVILHVTPNYAHRATGPKGNLIFARYGSEYFLKQAWIPSADFGMDFAPSNREIKLAKVFDKGKQTLVAVQGR